jgi:dihydroceramide fatty acyl 2-hydroxylase
VLEYFSHIHPITPIVTFTPVALLTIFFGLQKLAALWVVGLVLAGMLIWTLTEYVLHRWVFHYQPKSAWGQRIHFLVHGIHHDYPRDSTRLVMPLLVSIPLAVAFYMGFLAVFATFANPLFAGFILGYMAYDSIHYATHHLPMKSRMGRFLKTYHMRHHYEDDHTAYGVSNPMWDYVVGTVPPYLKNNARNAEITNKERQ